MREAKTTTTTVITASLVDFLVASFFISMQFYILLFASIVTATAAAAATDSSGMLVFAAETTTTASAAYLPSSLSSGVTKAGRMKYHRYSHHKKGVWGINNILFSNNCMNKDKFRLSIIKTTATSNEGDNDNSKKIERSIIQDENKKVHYKLPPGRPTNRWIRYLFDDTMNILNPNPYTMKLMKRKNKYGPIFKTNFLFRPAIFVTSRDSIQQLSKIEAQNMNTFQAFFPPQHYKLFGKTSLLVQSGNSHKRLRMLIQNSMIPALVTTNYEPLILQSITNFLNQQQQTGSTDIYIPMVPKLRILFMSIIVQIVLGRVDDISEAILHDIEIWSNGLLAPPLFFVPWSTASKALRARKRINKQLVSFINENDSENTSTTTNNNIDNKRGLLYKLIEESKKQEDNNSNNNKLTQEEIVDNIFTLIFAGSDTTSSAAISMWIILSHDKKLKDYLRSVIDSNNEEESSAIVDIFIQQILETYPPAPFQFREVVSKQDNSASDNNNNNGMMIMIDDDTNNNKYHIPPNWLIAYGYAAALDNGNEIPTVESILSELSTRPLNSNSYSNNPGNSLAFGGQGGPRRCPGRYLACCELKCFLKVLLEESDDESKSKYKYKWELEPNQSLKQMYTPGFFPKDGLKIKFVL